MDMNTRYARSLSLRGTVGDEKRKAANTRYHLREIDRAAGFLHKWPCVTTINNMRLALSAFEKDIKNGDAA